MSHRWACHCLVPLGRTLNSLPFLCIQPLLYPQDVSLELLRLWNRAPQRPHGCALLLSPSSVTDILSRDSAGRAHDFRQDCANLQCRPRRCPPYHAEDARRSPCQGWVLLRLFLLHILLTAGAKITGYLSWVSSPEAKEKRKKDIKDFVLGKVPFLRLLFHFSFWLTLFLLFSPSCEARRRVWSARSAGDVRDERPARHQLPLRPCAV